MGGHDPRFEALVDASRARIEELTVQDVRAMQVRGDDFVLVDTREDREWAVDRISGAIHIGKGVIERDAGSKLPDPDARIVLYCGGGFRSALAADALRQMGYRRVASMDGGIRDWRAATHPIDRGD